MCTVRKLLSVGHQWPRSLAHNGERLSVSGANQLKTWPGKSGCKCRERTDWRYTRHHRSHVTLLWTCASTTIQLTPYLALARGIFMIRSTVQISLEETIDRSISAKSVSVIWPTTSSSTASHCACAIKVASPSAVDLFRQSLFAEEDHSSAVCRATRFSGQCRMLYQN